MINQEKTYQLGKNGPYVSGIGLGGMGTANVPAGKII
jgi:hypothetical protein